MSSSQATTNRRRKTPPSARAGRREARPPWARSSPLLSREGRFPPCAAGILIECDQRARRILAEHDAGLRAVADALVKRRYLDADEVREIVRAHPTTSGYDNPLAEVAAALRSEADRPEDARIEAVIAADLADDV